MFVLDKTTHAEVTLQQVHMPLGKNSGHVTTCTCKGCFDVPLWKEELAWKRTKSRYSVLYVFKKSHHKKKMAWLLVIMLTGKVWTDLNGLRNALTLARDLHVLWKELMKRPRAKCWTRISRKLANGKSVNVKMYVLINVFYLILFRNLKEWGDDVGAYWSVIWLFQTLNKQKCYHLLSIST